MNKKSGKVQITSQNFNKWKSEGPKEGQQLRMRMSLPSKEQQSKSQDFPERMQPKAQNLELRLYQQRIEQINQQHPGLAYCSALSGILQLFDAGMRPYFKSFRNPNLLQIYGSYLHEIQKYVRQIANERKALIVDDRSVCLKDHPQDEAEKHKAVQYSTEIRELEDMFNRKLQFKEYAEEHFKGEKEEIEREIMGIAGKISKEVINQRFLPYYRRKVEENERAFKENSGRSHRQILNLFKQAAQSNLLQRERRTAMKQERVNVRSQLSEDMCVTLGSSLGYFTSLHDYFSAF